MEGNVLWEGSVPGSLDPEKPTLDPPNFICRYFWNF